MIRTLLAAAAICAVAGPAMADNALLAKIKEAAQITTEAVAYCHNDRFPASERQRYCDAILAKHDKVHERCPETKQGMVAEMLAPSGECEIALQEFIDTAARGYPCGLIVVQHGSAQELFAKRCR
jgi:hypothetical protein